MSRAGGSQQRFWAPAWHMLASDHLLGVLVGLLVLVALFTVWFPQAPHGPHHQMVNTDDWLSAVRPQLGRSADRLLDLGLLTVTQSGWFRLLLALGCLALLLRLFDAVQQTVDYPPPVRAAYSQSVDLRDSPAQILEALRVRLGRGARVREWTDDRACWRLEAHRPLASLGLAAVWAGTLLGIAGWLWTDEVGWRLSHVRLLSEAATPLNTTEQTVRLDDLAVAWGNDDQPTAAAGRLTVSDERQTAIGAMTLGSNWRWKGTAYRLTGVGPAVRVEGTDPSGMPLSLQTAANSPSVETLTLPLSPAEGPRSFAVAEQGVVIQVNAEPSEAAPRLRVRAYQGRAGELVVDRVISGTLTFDLSESRFWLTIVPFAELAATYAPGQPLLLAGAALAALGIIAAAVYRPRQLAVCVTDAGTSTTLTIVTRTRRDGTWAGELAGDVEAESGGSRNGRQ